MSTALKNKIAQRLNKMDATQLKQAWLIINEIGQDRKMPVITDKAKLEQQLAKGIKQLDNGEGADMSFVAGLKKKYGSR